MLQNKSQPFLDQIPEHAPAQHRFRLGSTVEIVGNFDSDFHWRGETNVSAMFGPNGAPEARGSKEFYKQVKGLTREAEDFVGRGVGRFFA
jgi:hypothetical protein